MVASLKNSNKYFGMYSVINPKYTLVIALEGLDGTYKETNSKALKDYCEEYFNKYSKDVSIKLLSFPRYKNHSSFFVNRYLKGTFESIIDDDRTGEGIEKCKHDLERVSIFFLEDMYSAIVEEINKQEIFYKPTVLILDRYFYSMLYYLTKNYLLYIERTRNFDINYIRKDIDTIIAPLVNDVFELPKADYVIKLKNTQEEFTKAFKTRDNNLDIYESDDAYLSSVNKLFNNTETNFIMASLTNNPSIDNIIEIEEEQRTREEIFSDIKDSLKTPLSKFKMKLAAINKMNPERLYWRK